MDGFQHWLNRIVKWRFEVFLTKEYDCKHGGENPRRGFAPFEYTTHFQMCKSSILESEREGALTELTKTYSRHLSWLNSIRVCFFLVAIFFSKPLNLQPFLCVISDVTLGNEWRLIRVRSSERWGQMQRWEPPSAPHVLPCCWWRLSCLAHTCLMTGLPMCWRDTPSNGTSGDQHSSHHHLWSDQCPIFVERYLLCF